MFGLFYGHDTDFDEFWKQGSLGAPGQYYSIIIDWR